jgi:toxin secretion/phage lysis holin
MEFISLSKTLLGKLAVAISSGIYFIESNQTAEAISILVLIIFLDTLLGTFTAIKLKKFSSWGMSRFAKKCTTYGITILTTHCAAVVINFGFDAIYFVTSYLIITEAISNFEKLHILGVPIPKRILSIINADFNDKEKMTEQWKAKVEVITPEKVIEEYLKQTKADSI